MDQFTSGTGIKRDFAPPRRIMSQPDLTFSREISHVPADKALGLLSAFSKGRNMTELQHRKTSSLPNYHSRSLRGPPKTPRQKSLAVVPEGDEAEDFNFNFADLKSSETPSHRPAAVPLQLSETPTPRSSIAKPKPTKTIPKPASPDKKRTELPTPTTTPTTTPIPSLSIPKRVSAPVLKEQYQQYERQQQAQQQAQQHLQPQPVPSPLRRKANTKEPLRAHAARRIPSGGPRQPPSVRTLKPEPITPSPSAKKVAPTPTPSPLARRNTTLSVGLHQKGHQRSYTAPALEIQAQQEEQQQKEQREKEHQKQQKQLRRKQQQREQQQERDESPRALPLSSKISRNAIVHAYYTILRDRHPGHYLVNLSEEEEDILSQKQYAELLQLACQRVRNEEVAHSGGETGEEDHDDEEDEDDDDDDDDDDDEDEDGDEHVRGGGQPLEENEDEQDRTEDEDEEDEYY